MRPAQSLDSAANYGLSEERIGAAIRALTSPAAIRARRRKIADDLMVDSWEVRHAPSIPRWEVVTKIDEVVDQDLTLGGSGASPD